MIVDGQPVEMVGTEKITKKQRYVKYCYINNILADHAVYFGIINAKSSSSYVGTYSSWTKGNAVNITVCTWKHVFDVYVYVGEMFKFVSLIKYCGSVYTKTPGSTYIWLDFGIYMGLMGAKLA